MKIEHQIGVISDTHGLLRAWAEQVLRGVDLIVHAGDIGSQNVLESLRQLAPVTAVRGNTDFEPWARRLPEKEMVQVAGHFLYVLHDADDLDIEPEATGVAVVICGHTHKPAVRRQRDVLYLNPGSAGPRRFDYPISLARLRISGGQIAEELIYL